VRGMSEKINNEIMLYLKRIIRKFNKYFMDKKEYNIKVRN